MVIIRLERVQYFSKQKSKLYKIKIFSAKKDKLKHIKLILSTF